MRTQLLVHFQKLVTDSLHFFDLTLPPGRSMMTDSLRACKHFLLCHAKTQLLNTHLDKTKWVLCGEVMGWQRDEWRIGSCD